MTKFEELISNKKSVELGRVLLRFDAPLRNYPEFGIWSYLLDAPDGVVVFDTGPQFHRFFGFRGASTQNAQTVLSFVKEVFPQKPIREIILSHYHFDHGESAPLLQRLATKEFGLRPPIRVHACDLEKKKLLGVIPSGLSKMYIRSGFSDWFFGDPVEDNEQIAGTNFWIKHTPGHTSGHITLVSDIHKIAIGGWWLRDIPDPIVQWLISRFVDEAPEELEETRQNSPFADYHCYHHHPHVEYTNKIVKKKHRGRGF